jgi:hypothetical protein
LTEAQKAASVQKCRQLFAWHAGDVIIIFEEILFLLQEIHNQQNFQVYSVSLKNIPQEKIAVKS